MIPINSLAFISSIVEALRPVFELLSFFGSIVVAIAAIAGLYQLKLARSAIDQAKNDLQIRSKREAIQLAAQQCDRYTKEIMPRRAGHLAAIASDGIKTQSWSLKDVGFNKESLSDLAGAEKWVTELRHHQKALLAATGMLNDLEGFAMWFVSGAADEEIAYPCLGPTFCDDVEALSPYLISLRGNTIPEMRSGQFPNLVHLYGVWHLRTRRRTLDAQVEQLSKDGRGAPTKIPPIGT